MWSGSGSGDRGIFRVRDFEGEGGTYAIAAAIDSIDDGSGVVQ